MTRCDRNVNRIAQKSARDRCESTFPSLVDGLLPELQHNSMTPHAPPIYTPTTLFIKAPRQPPSLCNASLPQRRTHVLHAVVKAIHHASSGERSFIFWGGGDFSTIVVQDLISSVMISSYTHAALSYLFLNLADNYV